MFQVMFFKKHILPLHCSGSPENALLLLRTVNIRCQHGGRPVDDIFLTLTWDTLATGAPVEE